MIEDTLREQSSPAALSGPCWVALVVESWFALVFATKSAMTNAVAKWPEAVIMAIENAGRTHAEGAISKAQPKLN
jgi:hypothetical protein